MTRLREAADEFLTCERVAVTGVSRTAKGHGGNIVYTRLRDRGHTVFAVNPNADRVEGDPCFPDLRSIPGGVDAVVVATRPEHAAGTLQECVDLGVKHAWMHRSLGAGSVDHDAAEQAREAGMTVIEGGCPLMFGDVSDPGHRVIRFVCRCAGSLPRQV